MALELHNLACQTAPRARHLPAAPACPTLGTRAHPHVFHRPDLLLLQPAAGPARTVFQVFNIDPELNGAVASSSQHDCSSDRCDMSQPELHDALA